MILGISLALLVAAILLILFNHLEVPEIPIYLASGLILSFFTSLAVGGGLVSQGFIEKEIMKDLALLGLSILIFYNTSGTIIDTRRDIAIKSFKTSIWLSSISFAIVAGISVYSGFGILESLIFGITASVGSTLLDSGLVKEEARENHIYGWLTENMNFYDDVFGIVTLSLIISYIVGINILTGLVASTGLIIVSLVSRKFYSDLLLKLTGNVNELVLLSGIATLISLVWVSEFTGISALAGVYASGVLLINTELGFKIRERFSAVKDFFTALSFISIGYLIGLPEIEYLAVAAGLTVITTIIRPMIATQMLRLEGYDLRTSFMSTIQSSQISEIMVVGSLLLAAYIQGPIFETIVLAFVGTVLIAHLIEDREQFLFEKLFSNYELDSEKSYIPEDLEGHLILAGYDWKTRELEDIVQELDVIVVDFSLEEIEVAERKGLPHLLADLHSNKAWEELNYQDASLIVSAIDDQSLIDKIKELDTDAEKVLVDSDSEDVRNELRKMLRESL